MTAHPSLFDPVPPALPSRHRLPVARARDPETSHLAGAKATKAVKLREAHAAVMMLFGMHGPMADHELIARARASQHPACQQSDSGLRSRRKELVREGKLQFVRRTTTPLGNPCDVWGIPK